MSKRAIPRRPEAILLVVLALVIATLLRILDSGESLPMAPPPSTDEGYTFVCWNLENLFDDQDDPKNHEELEDWFAESPDALTEKHRLLVDELIRVGDGLGPDILGVVEVENLRAVELLRDALNARLPSDWHYNVIVHEDNIQGRRIEPAIISRLPLTPAQPDLPFKGRRIVGGRFVAGNVPLTILVGHWTSRVTDSTGAKRLKYAQVMYDAYLQIESETEELEEVLICGDFNDEPDDESVRLGLRATGDLEVVQDSAQAAQPRLFHLMSNLEPIRASTYAYRGKWQTLDHLVVSPGLVDDQGWRVLLETAGAFTPEVRDREGKPLRFGNPDTPGNRGPSDHFPIALILEPPSMERNAIAEAAPPTRFPDVGEKGDASMKATEE